MLNLFRAQWYRLVRNRAFWGLLAVFGVLVFLFVIQVDEQSVREGVYRNFPALGGAPEGVGMTMDVEAVLGQFWVPQLLLAFVGMLSAAFFGDDFRYAGARSLDVMPGFRWRYVGSAVLIIVVIALIFLVAASFVAWLALLPNPVMSVGLSGGRFLRWGLLLVAITLWPHWPWWQRRIGLGWELLRSSFWWVFSPTHSFSLLRAGSQRFKGRSPQWFRRCPPRN